MNDKKKEAKVFLTTLNEDQSAYVLGWLSYNCMIDESFAKEILNCKDALKDFEEMRKK